MSGEKPNQKRKEKGENRLEIQIRKTVTGGDSLSKYQAIPSISSRGVGSTRGAPWSPMNPTDPVCL